MQTDNNGLQPPVNHVFVDFENVCDIDPTVIGSKTIHLTLLLGPKSKLTLTVAENLINHAGSVELIRLKSAGKNALDFALAYYIGRAVLADPTGYFHIIAKDKGYDPLVEHLRGKHIRARRHDDFSSLTFSPTSKPATAAPVASPAKSSTTEKAEPERRDSPLASLEKQVLIRLRKPTTPRPTTKKKLTSFVAAQFGSKVTPTEVTTLIEMLSQSGQVVADGKGKITYHL
jgi:hypothetical protein